LNNTNNIRKKAAKEPLVRIVKRDGVSLWQSAGVRVAAVILALIVNAIFIYSVTGLNPLEVYKTMWEGTFQSKYNFFTTLRDTAMLLCIGIALAPAFKMKFWNIGGEGQVLMGALATALVMIYLCNYLPNWLLIIVMFVAAVIAGGIVGADSRLFQSKVQYK